MTATTTTAELHVHQPRAEVATALDRHLLSAAAGIEADGGWVTAPWTRDVDAWRRSGCWRRGRAAAEVTIDLIDAGPRATLLAVALSPRHRTPFSATVTTDTAHTLARELRAIAEGDGAQPPLASPDPTTAAGRGGVPAATVGYSRA